MKYSLIEKGEDMQKREKTRKDKKDMRRYENENWEMKNWKKYIHLNQNISTENMVTKKLFFLYLSFYLVECIFIQLLIADTH